MPLSGLALRTLESRMNPSGETTVVGCSHLCSTASMPLRSKYAPKSMPARWSLNPRLADTTVCTPSSDATVANDGIPETVTASPRPNIEFRAAS